ncbi:MAG: U32 family peptidase C-terminal domain-containing protein, partial [Planctomycetaceae bacterium]|nr:U32 family peptidase C-terminal domain-containing protein [Planctomycetaceae bacterium]
KDLRAVQHVKTFTDMGISSLKIEGRTKSFFYAARTAQVYRKAIDDAVAGVEFNENLLEMLDSLSNRGYTEGFFQRHASESMQNYEHGRSVANQQQFVGDIIDRDADGLIVDVKNKFGLDDELELMTPAGNKVFQLKALLDKKSASIDVAPGSGHVVKIPLSENQLEDSAGKLSDHDQKFALLMKSVRTPAETSLV